MSYTTGSLRFFTGVLRVEVERVKFGNIVKITCTPPYIMHGSERRHDYKFYKSVLDIYDFLVEKDIYLDEIRIGRGAEKLTGGFYLNPSSELSDEDYLFLTDEEEIDTEELSPDLIAQMVEVGLLP